jgi:DNA mismatch endonuclease (patch repair protein)
MRSVRVRDTAPELAVRKLLHSLGARFRVRPTKLPGRPDITNGSKRWCIFVHGCFWHGHECRRGRPPKKNVSFWTQKIATNRARDARTQEALKAQGFRVLTVWQCELDDVASLKSKLATFTRTEGVEPAA